MSGRALASKVCMYTMTEGGDFLVRGMLEDERVMLVSACSGHGFKHSAALGERVAEAVVSGGMVGGMVGLEGFSGGGGVVARSAS